MVERRRRLLRLRSRTGGRAFLRRGRGRRRAREQLLRGVGKGGGTAPAPRRAGRCGGGRRHHGGPDRIDRRDHPGHGAPPRPRRRGGAAVPAGGGGPVPAGRNNRFGRTFLVGWIPHTVGRGRDGRNDGGGGTGRAVRNGGPRARAVNEKTATITA